MGEGVWAHRGPHELWEPWEQASAGVTLQSPLWGGYTPHCRVGPTFSGWETSFCMAASSIPSSCPGSPLPHAFPSMGSLCPLGQQSHQSIWSPHLVPVCGARDPPASTWPPAKPTTCSLRCLPPLHLQLPAPTGPRLMGLSKESPILSRKIKGVVSFLTDTHWKSNPRRDSPPHRGCEQNFISLPGNASCCLSPSQGEMGPGGLGLGRLGPLPPHQLLLSQRACKCVTRCLSGCVRPTQGVRAESTGAATVEGWSPGNRISLISPFSRILRRKNAGEGPVMRPEEEATWLLEARIRDLPVSSPRPHRALSQDFSKLSAK